MNSDADFHDLLNHMAEVIADLQVRSLQFFTLRFFGFLQKGWLYHVLSAWTILPSLSWAQSFLFLTVPA